MKRDAWINRDLLIIAMVTLLGAMERCLLFNPFSKMLQVHGMVHLVPKVSVYGTVGGILGILLMIQWSDRIGPKKMTIVAYSGTTLTPMLYAIEMVNQAATWLPITRFFASLLGAMAISGVGALLLRLLGKDRSIHQKRDAFNVSMASLGAIMGNFLAFGLIHHPLVWGGALSALNLFSLVMVIRLDEEKEVQQVVSWKRFRLDEEKKVQQVVSWRERFRLIFMYLPYIGIYMAYSALNQYAPLFLSVGMAAVMFIVYHLATTMGGWMATFIQPDQLQRKEALKERILSLVYFLAYLHSKAIRLVRLGPKFGLVLASVALWLVLVRPREKTVIRVGLTLAAVGLVLIQFNSQHDYLLLIGAALIAFGRGMYARPQSFLVNQSTKYQGAASGASLMVHNLGNLLVAGAVVMLGPDLIWCAVLVMGSIALFIKK